jgi:hypothetical protein
MIRMANTSPVEIYSPKDLKAEPPAKLNAFLDSTLNGVELVHGVQAHRSCNTRPQRMGINFTA